jgi:hypothetical protein
VATLLFSLLFVLATQKKMATQKHYGINDNKEKEQLPIVPLATLLLSCECGLTDNAKTIFPSRFHMGDNKHYRYYN